MGKIRIISFYLITLIGLFLEIIFLFVIPYYRYSHFLKYLKIIRILFGFIIFLIDIYFNCTAVSEIILAFKNEIQKEDEQVKDNFYLINIILIISGFVISLTCLILNIIGVTLTTDYLNKDKSTDLQNTYWTCSLILLFENILITICWIYFFIYWALNIYNFMKEKNKAIEKKNNQDEDAPPIPPGVNPIQNEQKSSDEIVDIK